MWELVATAASGLEAGAGLYAALVEGPSLASDTDSDTRWRVFAATSGPQLALSSGLGIASAGAALLAHYRGGTEDTGARGDPAWLTTALLAAAVPLYNALVLAPSAAAAQNKGLEALRAGERDAWVGSYGRKKLAGLALGGAAFASMLLVLGSPNKGSEAVRAAGAGRSPF
jgi:hypothetical protein